MTDVKKVIALNRLRAQMLDEEVSPAQKQYYLELAQWLENQNIQTAEEATESIKNTPYYDGAALAKELDGIHLRIRAARELGYEDVEKIHLQRREKLLSKGLQAYAFSQECVSFEELAQQKAYRQLTMTTEEGMARFVAFVEEFKKTGTAAGAVDLNHLKKEQERIGRWAKEHAAQLIAAGAQEQWNRASCIAVPSDDPMGYDFIAMKEVKV